ncbi:MAG TPA: hypothetical protein VG295_07935 [Solirubrobacteraceae bacterium]|nr:hypothetical protein [Solirubrobacteraceae bacterium]
MAESDPPEATKAQAEFAKYKDQLGQSGPAASFASPLPSAAIPAWSLRPGPGPAPGARGAGPGPYRPPAPGGTTYASIVDGVGTTLRLGVEVLNAALSSSLTMLNGVAWGGGGCDCEECNPCGGYDCCSVMSSGCGCCEPSVGGCC